MTKERKLAIEMWTNIRDMLSASGGQSPESFSHFKKTFCKKHSLQWYHGCWFCQYISACGKCPLGSCGHKSVYEKAVDTWLNTDVRIEACNNIIKALGGEV